MQYIVKINSLKTVEELENAWKTSDYIQLLKLFGYAEADQVNEKELKDYLYMAIADYETNEAAAIVLEYKLSEALVEGQIDNLSHEMTREKVAENYSDIFLHQALFNTNQLLYKAYNGKFPLTKATIITFELQGEEAIEITKDIVLQALSAGLSDSNLLHRLFEEQLEGKVAFPEADGIIWNLQSKGNATYQITTSEKWIKKDDFKEMQFEATVTPFEEEVDED
ncbi:MAG: hypothetical protein COZ75_12190 [Flavobacteriaceae bacterium CG_4_8_14_3_um_filter_34_10]|nr:hypothetical protein [Flavobacteriia bacterium]OIP49902.1 MAG: hypothetical protein AUK33_09015 [Flavobacteriaceae bacterium CG2_30_34_30]PIQ18666.1 MAG: hypothetical protein COW66_05210 [Flavobacteriaceae bacterium CG18_big_fil_WC_8_21_14_2_50_34_36]PIV51134.1 MAG: hypothetical protein COS19_02470 [Flavobacteriaceae bacterium CG02_land_8_20_14_3_00_34_13]PIX08414.1 MAG: hypothetical protein COZ75_12190 [Flavobacteriaceae bacterium CG_4_8_14_3_um_filter_34_10]PJC07741.1 MAG: hypothetical pr